LDTVVAHHRQLQLWAGDCPENFENRVALVGAEIARLEGRELDAERLYEQAIRSARAWLLCKFATSQVMSFEPSRACGAASSAVRLHLL